MIDKFKRIIASIKRNGWKAEFRRLFNFIKYKNPIPDDYKEWILMNEMDSKAIKAAKEYDSWFDINFAIVVEDEKSIESLEKQIYSKWHVVKKEDVLNDENQYVVFVGENIQLSEVALYEVLRAIENRDETAFYSDNDYIIDNKRVNPIFKPGFGIDTILSRNYIGDFLVVNTMFLKFHPEILDNLGSEIVYDLILRISDYTDQIFHIPKVLYHCLEERKQDYKKQKEIIQAYLERNNIQFDSIKDGMYEGDFKIDYSIIGNPKVSIVIPNMDHIDDLKALLDSIKKSTYSNYEIVIVENNSTEKNTFDYYEKIQKEDSRIKVEKLEINYFNYSRIVNYGVEKSSGEYVLLLNNDIEILTPDWIEQMLMYTQRKDVGACGIKLYFPDKTIQHAGVTIGVRGLAGHRYREVAEGEFSKKDYINIAQDLSAVTAACILVKKSDYVKVLGFDEKLAVAFNDIDFSMKIRKANLLIVYNPFAYAFHFESKSRGDDTATKETQKRFMKEYRMFTTRWQETIFRGDPYYNPNFKLDTDIPTINYNKVV